MRPLLLLLPLILVACGGQAATPPATPATPPAHDGPALPKALGKPRVTVEYVVVHRKWVEKTMTPAPADVTAWYETADGKAAAPPRRVLVAFSTKKKADSAAARMKKGESVETEIPDPATNASIDAAYDKLPLGDVVVIDDKKSFAVLKKDRPTDEAIERAYKKAKAPELTQKLAAALLSGMQKSETDARATIASVVGEILGERAVADPDRPQPVIIDDDRLRHARLQPNAKETVASMLKTAKPGETVKEPVVDGDTTTLARAAHPAER